MVLPCRTARQSLKWTKKLCNATKSKATIRQLIKQNFSRVVYHVTTALSMNNQLAICALLANPCYPSTTMDNAHLSKHAKTSLPTYHLTILGLEDCSTSIFLSHFRELYKKYEICARMPRVHFWYSKINVKRPLSERLKIGFQYKLSLNAGQQYRSILQYF